MPHPTKMFAGALCAALFLALPAFGGDIVTVISPAGSSVADSELLFEGQIEEQFVRSVRLTVEPFLSKESEKPFSRILKTDGGRFAETVPLFPGLNLLRLSTAGGRELLTLPVFLISPGEHPVSRADELGTQSPVFFTGPAEAKTRANPVTVKGLVSDASVKALDIVVLDTADLLTGAPAAKGRRIEYLSAPIERQQFSFAVPLKEGLNIILARRRGSPADVRAVQLKSIIYEKTSPHVALAEPEVRNKKLVLSGKVANELFDKVTVRVSALVERAGRPQMQMETIATASPATSRDGTFTAEIPWETEKFAFTIKSFPTITVYAGGETASKTVTRW